MLAPNERLSPMQPMINGSSDLTSLSKKRASLGMTLKPSPVDLADILASSDLAKRQLLVSMANCLRYLH